MEIIDYKKIMDARAPKNWRSLIQISRNDISPRYSSLTDYMDAVLGYVPKLLRGIDQLISRFLLGAVCKVVNGHYGTILPKINDKGVVVGGSVVYFSAESGNVLFHEPITSNLYHWYCFDYFTDKDVFFGEHLLSGRNIAVVHEEKTALLGKLAYPSLDWIAVGYGSNLTDRMVEKLRGRRAVLFPEDFDNEYWSEHYGNKLCIDTSFIDRDINRYLIDTILLRNGP